MGKRLKEIWSGFEETTSRKLTGGGVDNIHVPHRADFAGREDAPVLPEGLDQPTEAAFAVLRDRLQKQEKKFGARRRRGREFTQDPSASELMQQSMDGEELIKGLHATTMRTERTSIDYSSFMGTDEGKAVFKKLKKKKRFFGLF